MPADVSIDRIIECADRADLSNSTQDITREFPSALELGAYGPQVLQEVTAVEGLGGSKSRDKLTD